MATCTRIALMSSFILGLSGDLRPVEGSMAVSVAKPSDWLDRFRSFDSDVW